MAFRIFVSALLFSLFLSPLAFAAEDCSPVVLGQKQIICIRQGLGSISAQDRALNIENRLKALAADYSFAPEKVTISHSESGTFVVANETPLIAIGKKDIEASFGDEDSYAEEVAHRVRVAITAERASKSPQALFMGVLYTLLATSALFFCFFAVKRAQSWIDRKLTPITDLLFQNFKIKSYQVISPLRVRVVLGWLLATLKLLLNLFFLYIYLVSVLSFFPWTAQLAPQILHSILNPLHLILTAILNYIPNVFFIVFIVALAHYALKFIKIFFVEIEDGNIQFENFHREWAQPTFQLVKILIYALALVMAFPYLPGSSSPAFQGMSVFLGVLVSFGSGSAIANIISGIVITYMRPFKQGDRVKIADTVGDIIEKNLLVTRVKTIKNVDITIPNSMVLGSHIINFSSSAQEAGLILNTTVTIGYDAPWRKVHELLLAAAARTNLINKDKKCFVLQTALNDFYVAYELNAYTQHANSMASIYSELHQNIQDAFNEAGVEIMSPHYGALRDGNSIAIPDQYKDSPEESGRFRVSIKNEKL